MLGNKLKYMEFKFKKTPDKYLDDKKLFLYKECIDYNVDEIMSLYMDSYFTQDEKKYNKYKKKEKELLNYLDKHEDEELISEFKEEYITDDINEYEFDLEKTYIESTMVDIDSALEKFDENKIPLYIIFNNSSHWFPKIITKVSKGDFSHVGMSFKGPDEILSFSRSNKSNGMKVENIFELISDRSSSYLKIVALPLDKEVYKEVYKNIHKVRLKRSEYKYDLVSVITFPFRKAEEIVDWSWKNTTFFCSQFISWILGNVYEIIDTSHMTPVELQNRIMNIKNSIVIFDGKIDDFEVDVFTKFENNFRDIKYKIENNTKNEVEKIKSKLKQESRLVAESSSYLKDKDIKNMNTLYNILYNEFPDDNLNSSYHDALNKIILYK